MWEETTQILIELLFRGLTASRPWRSLLSRLQASERESEKDPFIPLLFCPGFPLRSAVSVSSSSAATHRPQVCAIDSACERLALAFPPLVPFKFRPRSLPGLPKISFSSFAPANLSTALLQERTRQRAVGGQVDGQGRPHRRQGRTRAEGWVSPRSCRQFQIIFWWSIILQLPLTKSPLTLTIWEP